MGLMCIAKGMGMITVRLPKDIEDRLVAMAEKTGQSKAAFARQAILERLGEMEDYYLATKALEEFKASGEQALSAEKMRTLIE